MGKIKDWFFGTKYKSGAEAAGGIVLLLIGIKILLEHYGVIALVLSMLTGR